MGSGNEMGSENEMGSGNEMGSSGGESNSSLMTVDDAPPPTTTAPPAPTPVYNFNPELYPAYDQHARRIGLEHKRHETGPAQGSGSYYRPRTHHYPGPNVTANDFPHVRALDVRVRPTVHPNSTPSGSRTRPRANNNPNQASQGQSAGPSRGKGKAVQREPSPDIAEEDSSPELQSNHPLEPEDFNPDIPDPEPALRELLGFGPEEEVSLSSLTDPPPGEKPGYPYPTLIKLAIYGSPNKRLTLQEIYHELMGRFRWFRDNAEDKAWQVSAKSASLHEIRIDMYRAF